MSLGVHHVRLQRRVTCARHIIYEAQASGDEGGPEGSVMSVPSLASSTCWFPASASLFRAFSSGANCGGDPPPELSEDFAATNYKKNKLFSKKESAAKSPCAGTGEGCGGSRARGGGCFGFGGAAALESGFRE